MLSSSGQNDFVFFPSCQEGKAMVYYPSANSEMKMRLADC